MSRKIAVVTTGAVSLGSYEAGVLYELFEIFRLYADQWIEDGHNIDDIKYEVDVLTGASAGSVNSVIYGLAAVYNPGLINAMKDIWIDGLDIKQLMGKGSLSKKSIFSDKVIQDLKKNIKQAVGTPLAGPLPARVGVGLTLANLSGIPYMVSFPNLHNKQYKLTTFADWYPFELIRNEKDDDQIKNMLDAATASGAFPFAFPACKITRSSADYLNTALPVPSDGQFKFTYVDGGIFNNEPVNRAKELAQKIGEEYKKETVSQGKNGQDGMSDRIYLLVDPTPPEETEAFDDDPDMAAVGQRLITAILSEAHFRDWNDAVKINRRIFWQDQFLMDIYNNFSGMDASTLTGVNATLSKAAGAMVSFKARPAHTSPKDISMSRLDEYAAKYWAENESRIWESLKDKVEEEKRPSFPDKSSLLGQTLIKFVFVMECIGALRAKVSLDIRPVFPVNNALLAGKFWGSFGGFLCRDLREHDFNVGRLTAREFVVRTKEEGGLDLDISGIKSKLAPIPPISNDLKGDIEDVPLKCRIEVRNILIAGVDKVMGSFIKRHWHFISGVLIVLCIAVAALEIAFRYAPLAVIAALIGSLGITDLLLRMAVKLRLKKELNKHFRI